MSKEYGVDEKGNTFLVREYPSTLRKVGYFLFAAAIIGGAIVSPIGEGVRNFAQRWLPDNQVQNAQVLKSPEVKRILQFVPDLGVNDIKDFDQEITRAPFEPTATLESAIIPDPIGTPEPTATLDMGSEFKWKVDQVRVNGENDLSVVFYQSFFDADYRVYIVASNGGDENDFILDFYDGDEIELDIGKMRRDGNIIRFYDPDGSELILDEHEEEMSITENIKVVIRSARFDINYGDYEFYLRWKNESVGFN